MNFPLVSVIIPAYNYAHYLPRAIDSVLAQTYHSFELIIVDDGSTDDTATVVGFYKSKYPDLIRYIHQNNGGPNAARNKGIACSGGSFIAFLDADDEWRPKKLETQVSCALANPNVGMIGCGCRWEAENGTVLSEGFGALVPPRDELIRFLKIRSFGFGGSSGVLIRRECFDVVGLFDEVLRGSEDRDMWLRIAHHFEIVNVADVLILVHFHETNCHTNYMLMLKSKLLFIEKHFQNDGALFKRKAMSYAFLDAAREAHRASHGLRAFLYSFRAICNFPIKTIPGDDKFQILVKSILPSWVLSLLRSG